MTTLCIELAKEEASILQEGEMLPHETSPSIFVQIGLDLEEQQCVPWF